MHVRRSPPSLWPFPVWCLWERKGLKWIPVADLGTSTVSLQHIWCIFPCDSQPSHLIVLFIYLNISAGDLESIPVVFPEEALVNFWKSLQQKSFWNLVHSCFFSPHLLRFLTSFLLSLKYTRTDLQRKSLKENRSPVLDDVDGKLFLFSISLIFNDTLLSSPLLLI